MSSLVSKGKPSMKKDLTNKPASCAYFTVSRTCCKVMSFFILFRMRGLPVSIPIEMLQHPACLSLRAISLVMWSALASQLQLISSFFSIMPSQISKHHFLLMVKISSANLNSFIPYFLCRISISFTTFAGLLNLIWCLNLLMWQKVHL